MVRQLIQKYGFKRIQIGLIGLLGITTIVFGISLFLAITNYINFNTYTSITM